ncbi:Chaperone DnaJ-domain superfamily protein [Perilla frutescens var. hirtella]|nr:Chaperone DnaJ-domain superfamily protein [Perilla frutescens var. hirtella]
MENISLSLPKRSFSSNTAFNSHKSVYDDVFGGPPKLVLPTLAPRFEDYSEIFGGFHTSQSSSIPVLHLPFIASEDSNLHFDVDYTEVFGGCGGFDFTASLEDLVGHSSGGYDSDSSDEPWSPAQSGTLSDELDPLVGSDKNHRLSDGDFQQSLESITKQNASYNKSCHMSAETVMTATSYATNFNAVPGYTFSLYESPVSWDGEDEHYSMGMVNNINHSRDYDARVIREKQHKCSSNPSCSGSDTHRNYSKLLEKHGNSTSPGDKPFVTVSDISLRTKPSRLPPPSRPPPALVVIKREHDKQNSEMKPCQHYTSDRVAEDIAPLFFDMEIDGTISAVGRESGNRNVKANHQVTKEPTERKYFHSLSAAQVEEKTIETVGKTSDIEGENFLRSRGDKTTASVSVAEERIESIKSTDILSGPQGVQCCNNSPDNPAEAVAWREATGYFEMQAEAKRTENEVEVKLKQMDSPKRKNIEKRFVDSQKMKQTTGKNEQNIIMEEFQRRFEDVEGAETREIVQDRTQAEGTEMQHGGGARKHSEKGGTYGLKENGVFLEDAKKHRERGEKSYVTAVHDKSAYRRLDCEKDTEAGKMIVNELASRKALEPARNDKDHKLIHEMNVIKGINQDTLKNDNDFLRFRLTETEAGNEEEAFETTGNMKLSRDTCLQEEMNEHAEEIDNIERNGYDGREVEGDLDSLVLIDGDQLKEVDGGYEVDEVTATKFSGKHDNIQMLKSDQRAFSSEGNRDLRNKTKSSTYESETGKVDTLVIGRFHEFSKNNDESQDKNTLSGTNNAVKTPCVPKQMLDSQVCGSGMRVSCVMSSKISSALGYSHGEGQKMNSAQFTGKRVNISDNCDPDQVITESVVSGGKVEDVSSFLKHNEDRLSSKKDATSQHNNDGLSSKKDATSQHNDDGLSSKKDATSQHNVDRAALEARERSYFEGRERAERAAVERATVEVRQRALAEAQERLEKASMEARLRSDRAAVERATAEARQRAAEKLMAQKSAYDRFDPVDRSVPDRFSASSRSTDTRQSYLSSDIHFQGTGTSNRYQYSSAHDGAESESPQRCKARLERYRRTAERAANALAEKNRRDLLAQREREERNRVAEALDAEVKRWSSGKEGNLRALLSTLQYILGPDSGWHPVSLTEVITSAAVKKAYRRATLCVHPDKLQQRGATVHQKYICEKVFDLLKEAWNKFNSEER